MYVARHQSITYWANPVANGVGGWSFDAPIVLIGRWEEHSERVEDKDGNDYVSNAQASFEGGVKIGGYLYNGISVASDPTTVDGAYVIMKVDSIPDLRAIRQVNKAYM